MDNKPVIITGSAENLFKDLAALREELIKPPECDVICVNRSVFYYPFFFQHWVSLDVSMVRDLIWVRNKCSFITHSNKVAPGIDKVWPIDAWNGDSGLLAVRIAVRLDYKKIILCGMPLDSRSKIDQLKPNGCSFDCTTNIKLWQEMARDEFEDRARSMSGNTRDFLGAPTKEWLYGKQS